MELQSQRPTIKIPTTVGSIEVTMEGQNVDFPSTGSQRESQTGYVETFGKLLRVSEEDLSRANHYMAKLRELTSCLNFEKMALACLFCSSAELKVSDLFHHDETRMLLVDLYDKVNLVIEIVGEELDPKFKQNIALSQKRLVLLDSLFENYYLELFSSYFSWETDEMTDSPLFQFGWFFFLYTASQLNTNECDFLEYYYIFISAMSFFADRCKQCKAQAQDILNHFKYEIPEDFSNKINKIGYELLHQKLKIDKSSSFTRHQENITVLSAILDQVQQIGKTDFDPKVFATNYKFVGLCRNLVTPFVVQTKLHDFSSNNQSNILFTPQKKNVEESTGKPVSVMDATLHSIDHLLTKFQKESEDPDEKLVLYCEEASIDVNQSESVKIRIESLLATFSFDDSMLDQSKSQRISMIKKLFYRVLSDILQAEEKIRGTHNFSELLSHQAFVPCLIACSIESILFAYNTKHMFSFEDMIDRMNVKPFDLIKIIETFLLNSQWLTSPFKRHFRYIEDCCLDSLGWRDKSSPVFTESMGADVVPAPGYKTPVKTKRARIFNSFTSQKPTKSSEFFFRKVYRLVAQRIHQLCSLFNNVQQEDMEKVWSFIYYILNQKRNMLFDRHLDHLIICSSFFVLKNVKKMEIKFSRFLGSYRYHCQEHNRYMRPVDVDRILTSIPLEGGETCDIVKFFNKVYVPGIKDFYLQEEKEFIQKPDVNPRMPTITSPQRRRITNSRSFFVSPLKKRSTPHSRTLYHFGEHTTEKMDEREKGNTFSGKKRKLDLDSESSNENAYIQQKFQKLENSDRKKKRGAGRKLEF